MGAWSYEPFGNDDANDWAYELEETDDLSHIEAAGTQADACTEKVDDWVKTVRIQPSRALLDKARRALDRIRGKDSELKDLWHEGDATEWEASLKALQTAVSG